MSITRNIVESILTLLLIVGLVVGAIGYKPFLNKLTQEKGYDADIWGKVPCMLAMAALICGLMASESVGAVAAVIGIVLCLGLLVYVVLKHAKAIGIRDALIFTLLQMLSMAWVCLIWVVKMAWKTVNSFFTQHNDLESKKTAMSQDSQLRSRYLHTGDGQSAKASGASDVEAAAIAALREEARAYGEDV